MTKSQNLYILLLKRPIGFLGALLGLVVLSPIFLGKCGWALVNVV